MSGLRSLGPVAARIVDEVRLRRLIQHFHRLGPAPLGHFLQEMIDEFDLAAPVAAKLELYGRIDAEFIKINCGDQFAPPPLHIVGER